MAQRSNMGASGRFCGFHSKRICRSCCWSSSLIWPISFRIFLYFLWFQTFFFTLFPFYLLHFLSGTEWTTLNKGWSSGQPLLAASSLVKPICLSNDSKHVFFAIDLVVSKGQWMNFCDTKSLCAGKLEVNLLNLNMGLVTSQFFFFYFSFFLCVCGFLFTL